MTAHDSYEPYFAEGLRKFRERMDRIRTLMQDLRERTDLASSGDLPARERPKGLQPENECDSVDLADVGEPK